jgi:AraC-like DNA-binding protein
MRDFIILTDSTSDLTLEMRQAYAIEYVPMQYIIDRRMKRAASMLRSGYFTLAEVAAEAGFANVYYFSTAFKRHFGVPPGKWREHSL